jgi:hypothetical protein
MPNSAGDFYRGGQAYIQSDEKEDTGLLQTEMILNESDVEQKYIETKVNPGMHS